MIAITVVDFGSKALEFLGLVEDDDDKENSSSNHHVRLISLRKPDQIKLASLPLFT